MKPVYLVQGSEEHLVAEVIDELKAKLVGDRPAEMVVSEIEGDDAIGRLLEAAHTPAFVEGERVLIARLGQVSAEDGDRLVAYLESPSPDAVAIVSAEGRLPSRLAAAVKDLGELTQVSAPPPNRRADWIATRARAAGLSITGEAAKHLADTLGDGVTAIGPVLTQLRVAYPELGRIGIGEVTALTSGPRRGPTWDLTDAIDRGDAASALSLLAGSMAEGMHPLQIVAVLHTHFRRLALVVGRNEDVDVLASELKVKRYPTEKAMAQAARIGERGIRRALSLLARADLDLKGASALPAETIVEVLVVKLCGTPVTASR